MLVDKNSRVQTNETTTAQAHKLKGKGIVIIKPTSKLFVSTVDISFQWSTFL